jgi:hypothetical protein
MPSTAATHRQTESSSRPAPPDGDDLGEHLTVRNHDAKGGYGLAIRVTDSTGNCERTEYFVGADTTKRVFDCCEPGEVTVEVFRCDEPVATLATTVDETPSGTVVVECADGVVTAETGPAP